MFFSSSSWGNCSWTSEKKNTIQNGSSNYLPFLWANSSSPFPTSQREFQSRPRTHLPTSRWIFCFFSSRWHFGGSCRGFTADEWNRGPTDTARLGSFGTWASWPSQNKWLMGSLVAAPTRWAPNQSKKWSYGFGATLRSQKKSRELEDEEMSPLWGFFKALFSVSGV